MKKVVLIGGGTGLSAMMEGLKSLKDVELSAIITVADDGGSTGRLREAYHIPAMGDIRHVLSAMGDGNNELFENLMNYRFSGDGDIGGHQLGNLIFLALTDLTGSFTGAIESISKVLKVKGKIIPSTLDNAYLYAWMGDGTLVRGEKNIPDVDNTIEKVFYQNPVKPYAKAIEAIQNADLIIYGTGSLYTSILPNLIIPEIAQAIYDNPCKRVYFCNTMTQPGETDGYSVEDHVKAIENHTFKGAVDVVVYNDKAVPDEILEKYKAQGSLPVKVRDEHHSYKMMPDSLISIDAHEHVRHNPKAVANKVKELVELFV